MEIARALIETLKKLCLLFREAHIKFCLIETARFVNLPLPKRMESVKRHRRWQKELDKEKFIKDIFG